VGRCMSGQNKWVTRVRTGTVTMTAKENWRHNRYVVFPVQSILGLRQIGGHVLTVTCYITRVLGKIKKEAFNNEKGNIIILLQRKTNRQRHNDFKNKVNF